MKVALIDFSSRSARVAAFRRPVSGPAETRNPVQHHSPPGRYMPAIILPCLIFLLAGLVQGLTGFGGALVALPLLSLIMDVQQAVPLVILNGLAITTTLAWQLRAQLDRRKIFPLLVGSLPGIAFGTTLLKLADPAAMNRFLGILLVVISIINLSIRLRPINPPIFWGYFAGFMSGTINASVGAGGPPVILFTLLHNWKKDEIRATLTGFFALSGYVTAVAHAGNGLITTAVLGTLVLTVGFVLIGTHIGNRISGRINRRLYLRVVYTLLIGLGVMLLLK